MPEVSKSSISEAIRTRILDWAGPAFPLETREEAARVYADCMAGKQSDEIEAYSGELEFGTGGLRGILGNGSGRMNVYTVGRATLALCRVLKARSRKPALVIAFDSRRKSDQFSLITAGIAAGQGFQVYLFDDVAPTPMLSYAVRKLNGTGGVVITASHNPPEYNGYKVYGSDGSQIVGSDQKEIEKQIASIRWEEIQFLSETDPAFKKNVKRIGSDIRKTYFQEIAKTPFATPAKPDKKKFHLVYSPLHGTGGKWVPDLLRHFGFQVSVVPEQEQPNGEFPTVKYPNPEEADALKLSRELSIQKDADLFMATDPDADRLGIGVKIDKGNYALLNGNQIGSVLCAHLCEKIAAEKKNPGSYHVYKTIVTTDLQKCIAEANGIKIHDVLTGFKYIAEQMRLLDTGSKEMNYKKGKEIYLFGGEESYGYLPVDFVRDKDSLSSALLLCEILAQRGDLLAYLNQVYLKYGLYLEDLKSVTMKGADGQKKIKEIMLRLRNENWTGLPVGERKIVSVLDYLNQTRDGKKAPAVFGQLPPADVIQMILEPEGKLTIRPSGTEPKVKLYVSLKSSGSPTSLEELEKGRLELENELASVSGVFIAKTGLAG
ncbi:MAG: phospho-sugar mutase [Leptospirales bacterium]|nr:phospho-sugar mutase [Leptospirales bacterium]